MESLACGLKGPQVSLIVPSPVRDCSVEPPGIWLLSSVCCTLAPAPGVGVEGAVVLSGGGVLLADGRRVQT